MPLKTAAWASLVILTAAATALLLMFLGEDVYQERARRVLFAQHHEPAIDLPV